MGHPAVEMSGQAVEEIEPAITRAGYLVTLLDEGVESSSDQVVAYMCRSTSGASLIVRVRQPPQLKGRVFAIIMPDPGSKNRGFFAESKLTLKLQSVLGQLAKE
jgi:hypothetical protein